MTKIVLVHVKENFTPVPPMGILYIGTILKQKSHNVKVFDVTPNQQQEAIQKIEEFDPAIIGFSVMTTSYSITQQFHKELRNKLPYAYYCWGGVHPTALPIETLNENKLDFLVYGEAELTMVEVCERITKKKTLPKQGVNLEGIKGVYYFYEEEIHQTSPRPYIEDLDTIPIPDRTLLENFKWYLSPPGILRRKFYYGITTIYTSRGCPHKCIFCASKTVLGTRIRQRSVANVIKEIKYLKKEFGVRGIYFNDDTFATSKVWLKEFCDTLNKNNLDLVWGCQTRANIAQDLEICEMMAYAGCVQIDIGAESGSDKVLKILKKGITSKMILKSFENLKKVKIDTFATFIIGNPDETLADIKQTEQVARKAPGGVSFLLLVPYPGSALYQMAKENQWFIRNSEHIVFDERWTNKQSDVPVMEASFKADELVGIRAKLENKFLIKNYSLLMFDFIKNPYFFYKLMLTIINNPKYMYLSTREAIKRKKMMYLLEDIYQKFNETIGG